MRTTELAKYLDIFCRAANVPIMLWGAPGIGKTSAVEAWAKARGMDVEVQIASLLDPAEVGGIPMPVETENGTTVRYILPEWFLNLVHHKNENGAVLFLDEINAASPSVQTAMLRIIQSRAIHKTYLPDDVVIIAAGNPPKDMELALELPTAMRSRMGHIDCTSPTPEESELGDTYDWDMVPPPNPVAPDQKKNLAIWSAITSRYRKANPKVVEDLTNNEGLVAKEGRGYPCPRSWTNLAKILSYVPRSDLETIQVASRAMLHVAAPAFAHYAYSLDLPDPEEWLADPKRATTLDSDDRTVTALAAVTAAAINTTNDRWYAALQCAMNIAEKRSVGITVPSAKILLANKPQQKRPKMMAKLDEIYGPALALVKQAG